MGGGFVSVMDASEVSGPFIGVFAVFLGFALPDTHAINLLGQQGVGVSAHGAFADVEMRSRLGGLEQLKEQLGIYGQLNATDLWAVVEAWLLDGMVSELGGSKDVHWW